MSKEIDYLSTHKAIVKAIIYDKAVRKLEKWKKENNTDIPIKVVEEWFSNKNRN